MSIQPIPSHQCRFKCLIIQAENHENPRRFCSTLCQAPNLHQKEILDRFNSQILLIKLHQIPWVSHCPHNTSVKHGREMQPPTETPHHYPCVTDNQAPRAGLVFDGTLWITPLHLKPLRERQHSHCLAFVREIIALQTADVKWQTLNHRANGKLKNCDKKFIKTIWVKRLWKQASVLIWLIGIPNAIKNFTKG